MGHSTAYSEVALCRFASSQSFANLMHNLMLPSSQSGHRSVLHSLLLEFDRHGWLVVKIEGEAAGVLKLSGCQSVIRSTAKKK